MLTVTLTTSKTKQTETSDVRATLLFLTILLYPALAHRKEKKRCYCSHKGRSPAYSNTTVSSFVLWTIAAT